MLLQGAPVADATITEAIKAEPLTPAQLALRIDQFVEQSAIGPLANTCSDADFLRRIYLDLVGVIPDAQTARAFLLDTAADKRPREIERLISSPIQSLHDAPVIGLAVGTTHRKKHSATKLGTLSLQLHRQRQTARPTGQ